ncbi:hypothetical protein HOLleu_39365 [Holothuria leucospilota]|uniref:Uncharacterized protein n=1 Tax=Holothuria leucospilota TaxID=206669 RepID=A0A9Q0YG33_HOLLE|nr:hypothetical protein HOLleu_39365 [Holothuria leucospilota]
MDTDEDTIWKNPSKSVVYSWMTDYIFLETWEEFCAEYSVDSETDRKLISGIVQKVGNGSKSPEFILKTSLLVFMSFLSDAKDDLKDKNGDFEETILERALTVLEKNLQVEQFEKEMRQLARALRLQAVLCCCRRGEWTLAEEVSQRLWPEDSEDRSAEKKIVRHILSSKKGNKPLDRYMSYPAFLEKTKNLLAKVVAQFSVPFLQTVCRRLTTMPNSQETDDCSEYHSAEEGDNPNPSQMELIDPGISQENDPAGVHTEDVNNNQNNATQEYLMKALDLQPQKKAGQSDKIGEDAEEETEQEDVEDDVDVEVTQIEIRERELRSRTVPGYVKQTMTLRTPKKLVVDVNKLELQEKDKVEDEETQIDNEIGDGEHDAVDHVTEVPESQDESGERQEGSNDGEKRKRKDKEMEIEATSNGAGEDDDQDTSEIPPVSLTMLKHSFRKLGYGSQFWKGVEEQFGSLHETLDKPVVSKDEESSSPEESSDPRKTSTPVKNKFQRPLTFPPLVPSKLGRMKQLQIRPTNSASGIFLPSKNLSKGVDEAGPSGVSNESPSNKDKRRKRLRELESHNEEEEGVRVIWNSDDDDSSDSSIGSVISKASLKSPKLRRSLEGTSADIRRPWTKDEVKKLIKGVIRFGVGKWAEIQDHYEFDRTNVNIKDKWRNLVRKYGTSNPHKMVAE